MKMSFKLTLTAILHAEGSSVFDVADQIERHGISSVILSQLENRTATVELKVYGPEDEIDDASNQTAVISLYGDKAAPVAEGRKF